MLKVIVDGHISFILMGIFVAVGVISKIVVSVTLKRLVKAASDMSKSSHALMRLVRAKFEHACMVSDKVQNVEVFAEKYLYEYRVLGLRLHKLQRMETGSAWLCLVIGACGALADYRVYGMSESVFRTGVTGVVEAVLLFLLHKVTDEKYQLAAVKNYMVDYLENVCARRLEKAMKKEEAVPAVKPEVVPNAKPEPIAAPKPEVIPNTPMEMPEPEEVPNTVQGIKAVNPSQEKTEPKAQQKNLDKPAELKDKKQIPKEVLIREILEEFLA